MKILAIDSSGQVASVALADEKELIAEYTTNYKMTHSQTLVPMLEEVKNKLSLDLQSIDYLAVAAGPGSFTGLRIGSATVKGLGLALNKEIVEVPTLEGLAYNLWGTETLVCPIMDARRNQVYTGIYRLLEEGLTPVMEQTAMDMDELLTKCASLGEKVIFLGDGVPVYREKIAAFEGLNYNLAPAHLNLQRAGSVAALAIWYAKNGKVVTAAAHEPEYLRKSQAEREREQANA